VSSGLRRVGLASWLVLGITGVVALVAVLLMLAAGIVGPFVFAALFGAVVFPLVDRLERWHVPRWVAALLMVALAVALMALVTWVIVDSVAQQWPEITANLERALDEIRDWMGAHGVDAPSAEDVKSTARSFAETVAGGVASTVGGVASSIAQLGFGIFIGLNILFWIAKDGRKIGCWAGRHTTLPVEVGETIVKDGVITLQRYFRGVTLIAALNAAVVWIGAAVIGVPLATTIALVTFVFAYVPYFGAIIGGAFAVLLALGSGGAEQALAMLVVVILANGPIQNVAQQFVIGDALEMHPLSIIVITTAGGIVGGVIASMFAAPFAKIVLDARRIIGEAGVFADSPEVAENPHGPDPGADVGASPPTPAEPVAAVDATEA
jgi:predicted PurR-regulated permease PerM